MTVSVNEFKQRGLKKHNAAYDYSQITKDNFPGMRGIVDIICLECGLNFPQNADSHVNAGTGCPKCSYAIRTKNRTMSNETFISRSKEKFGDFFDYTLTNCLGTKKEVTIICPIHDEFDIRVDVHLKSDYGCQKCGRESKFAQQRYTKDEFIAMATEVHDNSYNYDDIDYYDLETPILISCKIHPELGSFPVSPEKHIYRFYGCPVCNKTIGKNPLKIIRFLRRLDIEFEREKTFQECRYINVLRFDFYLPDYNILIEYDGEFHFQPIRGKEALKLQKIKDQIKNDWVDSQPDIDLLRITYEEQDNIEQILIDYLCL